MSISKIQDNYVEQFAKFDTWEDRYSEIVKLGKELAPLEDEFKVDKFKVKGCQSSVWLTAKLDDGKVIYSADSDAMIVKGIIALLVNTFSGHSPQDIMNSNLDYLDKIGLRQHLSMNRSNGLTSMIKQIKMYAMAFSTQV